MKSLLTPGTIEPLEARIAPAQVFVGAIGATDTAKDTEYNETNAFDPKQPLFHNTGDAKTLLVGGTPNTYYIELGAGDQLLQFTSGGYQPLITVTRGTLLAFFVDGNVLNEVEAGELTGISLGKGVSAQIASSLTGSILTNYDDKSETVMMDSLGGPKQNIGSLVIGGAVSGGIYAGGAITNVTVQGSVPDLLTGSAANGLNFDLLLGAAGGEGTLSIVPAPREAGGSISKISLGGVTRLQAGDGGESGKGGSISQIEIIQDTTGMLIQAGKGGVGVGGKSGGVGGSISKIFVSGFSDGTDNDSIRILAGDGGNVTAGDNGKGGAGGKASDIYVGYDKSGNTPTASGGLLADNVEIAAGKGGDGKNGGLGGTLTNAKVLSVTPDDLLAPYEIIVRAGNGGAPNNAASGVAGHGGKLSRVDFQMQEPDVAQGASILVEGGDGGVSAVANANIRGGNGGSVDTVTAQAFNIDVFAGDGSSGKTGGNGGALSKLTFTQLDSILTKSANLSAGKGGDGLNGNGGKGGNTANLLVTNSDLTGFTINAGMGANGGMGTKGKGGNAGSVTGFDLIDSNTNFGFNGEFFVRAGTGGDGSKGGGKGGDISKGNFFGEDMEIIVRAGDGGSALLSGSGATGGKLTSLNLTSDGLFTGRQVNGFVSSGTGGNGADRGKGANGGDAKTVNINVAGNVSLTAGDGGNGTATAAAGNGGSLTAVGAFARDGSGLLEAGDAGIISAKKAKGGSVQGGGSQLAGLRVSTDLVVRAGDGAGGGDGGNIKGLAIGSTADSLRPTPSGIVTIQAGNGSSFGATAGKGGSIDKVDGNPSSGAGQLTTIIAGDGGGTAFAADETTAGGAAVQEIQTFNIAAIQGSADNSFKLRYGSYYTPNLSGTATAADVQAALNALNDVDAAGGVTVAPGGALGDFVVTFNNPGARVATVGHTSLGVASAAGGSISNLTIAGVGDDTPIDPLTLLPIENFAPNRVDIVIQAGDAGDALTSKPGAKGGFVKGVSISNLDPDTLVRSIAAGDGGSSDPLSGRGGVGGDIDDVRLLGGVDLFTGVTLNADIGHRSGFAYGYNSMGGIFAGAGGVGGSKPGAAGSVSDVSADSIAAIVAGRGAAPELVDKVEKITLNNLKALKTAGPSPFAVTYTGLNTTPVITSLDPNVLETQINNLGTPPVPDVNVIRTLLSTFQITNSVNGDIDQFTAEEYVPGLTIEETSGAQVLPVKEVIPGTLVNSEVQYFKPFDNGNYALAFGGTNLPGNFTPDLPFNANATDVENALNALPRVTAIGGVTVTGDPTAGFTITFNLSEARDSITGTANIEETQSIDVLGVGEFEITYDIYTTGRIAAGASAAVVETELNTTIAPSGVTVTVTDGPNSSYIVKFNVPGDQPELAVTEFIPLAAATTQEGDGTRPEIQTLSFVARETFAPRDYAVANLVGAIVDPNELGAPVFKFLKGPGNVGATFELGDLPIDGLVMARIFNQSTVNFTPEALFVTTDNGKPLPAGQNPFFDNDNKL